MGSFGDYLEAELLDHVFGCGSRNYTPPTNIYVGLSTADPGDDNAGLSEPSGNGYARVSTSGTDWNTASGTTPTLVDNANDITFPEATGPWGTVAYFILIDANSGGNQLVNGSLTTSKAIDDGDTAKFSAGDLDVTLD